MTGDCNEGKPTFQYQTLTDEHGNPVSSVADVARVMIEGAFNAADAAKQRYEATVLSQPERLRIQTTTALEELRKIQETAAWGIRMLVELAGIERREVNETVARRRYPSQREMVEAGGISLATVHSWIHNPAIVVDGKHGPGSLPKPGQPSHGHVARRPRYDSDYDDYEATTEV